MKATHVLDASAALRLFLGDGPPLAGLDAVIEAAAGAELALVVPDLFWVEVCHVVLCLERRGVLSADEADALLADLRRLPCRTIAHAQILDHIAAVARSQRLSGYDACYLALARGLEARLWTADVALAAAAVSGPAR